MNLFGDDVIDEEDISVDFDTAETLLPANKSSLFISHEKIEQRLLSLWNRGRMPHALVFNGLKGIGKATFAYRLARFILKESSTEGNGGLFGDEVSSENLSISTDHPVFTKIASGAHLDLITISRPFDEKKGQYKNEIPVDDIRKVAPFLRKTSGDGGWRIVIVDDANTMNYKGQNALLKILEEPPKNVLLILVTHGVGGLIPTIRSRCQFIDFEPLNDDIVEELIGKVSDAPLMPDDIEILTSMSQGSAGQAIELLQNGGVDAVRSLLEILIDINDISYDKMDKLAISYGKSGDNKVIKQFTFILNWWFETIIFMASKGQTNTYVGGITISVPKGNTLKSLLMLHEAVEEHINACHNGNLDKRYMIYKTLRMIQNACK